MTSISPGSGSAGLLWMGLGLATTLGTALAGVGIYRRDTARLFKELET